MLCLVVLCCVESCYVVVLSRAVFSCVVFVLCCVGSCYVVLS